MKEEVMKQVINEVRQAGGYIAETEFDLLDPKSKSQSPNKTGETIGGHKSHDSEDNPLKRTVGSNQVNRIYSTGSGDAQPGSVKNKPYSTAVQTPSS